MSKNYPTKQEAIEQVIANNPTDYARLLAFAEVWITTRMKEFTPEDLKEAFLKHHEPIANCNVYGPVFNTLCRRGSITVKKYTSASLPAAHGRELRVYISKEFRLRQQANAKAKYQYPTLFQI